MQRACTFKHQACTCTYTRARQEPVHAFNGDYSLTIIVCNCCIALFILFKAFVLLYVILHKGIDLFGDKALPFDTWNNNYWDAGLSQF